MPKSIDKENITDYLPKLFASRPSIRNKGYLRLYYCSSLNLADLRLYHRSSLGSADVVSPSPDKFILMDPVEIDLGDDDFGFQLIFEKELNVLRVADLAEFSKIVHPELFGQDFQIVNVSTDEGEFFDQTDSMHGSSLV